MKNKINFKRGLSTLLASTTLLGAVGKANAIDFPPYSARVNSGYTDNGSGSHETKTIFSIANKGNYYGKRYGASSQFGDKFRLVNIKSNNQDYTSVGARITSVSGLEMIKGVFPYASFGDIEGVGLETLVSLGKANITLNTESRTKPTSANHFGIGLDYRINDSLFVGGGIDRVEDDGIKNQYLLNTKIRLSPTDTIGVAGVIAKNPDKSINKGVGGFWIHYGKDEKWGVRARAKGDFNERRDQKNFGSEIIFAEKPTTGEPGATWIVGRNIRNDEEYNHGIIPIAVNKVFGVPLMDRADEGYSILVKGNIQDNSGKKTGLIKGAIANIENKGSDYEDNPFSEIGYSIGATHKFNGLTKDNTTIDLEAIKRDGRFTLNPFLSVDVNSGNIFGGINLTVKL